MLTDSGMLPLPMLLSPSFYMRERNQFCSRNWHPDIPIQGH